MNKTEKDFLDVALYTLRAIVIIVILAIVILVVWTATHM